ncbi:MAG: LacI family DNA-binding transcriptional regulator [Aestuariivita sp.]|nr:LacI family DNA-binding transcriptional regulator [Aestuariivita sp.]MCY4346999.1 LacI family DNA-binding transcriptional regulator [Aestuariivita sp.]
MTSSGRATIESLARELGVSASTVSRALNGYDDISEETRLRVQEAADEAGYQLVSERKKKHTKTNAVGLVVEMWSLDISSPFFGQFLRGSTAALRREGYDLLVSSTDGAREALKVYEYLIAEGRVDGFILTRLRSTDARVTLLNERNVPFVCFGREQDGGDYAWHDVDAAAAAEQSVAHLVELGHRQLGMLQAPAEVNFVRLRQERFVAALKKHGITPDQQHIIQAGLTATDAAEATRELLKQDCPPTALVCDLDALAIGAMAAIRQTGLTPGKDISVIGYGNDPFSAFSEPPLTTFSQNAELAGRWVAEIFLATMGGTTPKILQRMRSAEFVERQSAAPPVQH